MSSLFGSLEKWGVIKGSISLLCFDKAVKFFTRLIIFEIREIYEDDM